MLVTSVGAENRWLEGHEVEMLTWSAGKTLVRAQEDAWAPILAWGRSYMSWRPANVKKKTRGLPVRGMGHAQAMQVKPYGLEGARGPGRRNGPDLGLLGLMGLGPIKSMKKKDKVKQKK